MSIASHLVLYKASAGSGKTYTLAKEFLKIVLLNPYDYNKILAVTFTRKATQEMKSRIIDYLVLLEKKDPSVDTLRQSIIDEITKSKQINISDRFDNNVHTALQLILHDYSNFNISTIDSFFQSIIRSFSKELDLPIGMEVELDTDAVIEHGVEQMLKEYKTDKDDFSKWMEDYLFDLIEEDKSWKVERHITKLARQLLREEYQLLAKSTGEQFDIQTYKSVLEELKQWVYSYRAHLTTLTDQLLLRVDSEQLDLTKYLQGARSVRSFINGVRDFTPKANSYVKGMLEGGPLYSKSIKDEVLAAALEGAWTNYIAAYINEVLSYQEKYHKRYTSAEIVLKNIYALALLEFVNLKIIQYKSQENLVLISDTNQIVSAIAKYDDVPFIFEKSANFLKYILVDEFQDTSSLQWSGMLPLLLEILQQVNGLVLIVGDPKQSIYRWRGGKMDLIVEGVQRDMPFHWNEDGNIALNDNYRSAQEIIHFNNTFFTTLKDTTQFKNPFYKKVLEDVCQEFKKKDKSGYVQCKWLKGDSQDEDVHLAEVLQTVHSLYPSRSYSDIAILTRSNKDGAKVANYLQQQGIPVVSAESLLLFNKLNIKLAIAVLEYVLHPQEAFYAVKFNYLYAKYQGLESVEQYLVKKDVEENYYFESKLPSLSRRHVDHFASGSVQESLFVLLHEIGLDITADSYLLRLQEIVLEFSRQQSGAISDFLLYWEEQKNKLCILPPDGLDAVKIYTIHKSKGLQFPVVIVPYASWQMTPKHDSMVWLRSDVPPFNKLSAFPVETMKKLGESFFEENYLIEKEAAFMDNVNLLYVAFTRAEEQLYIFSDAVSERKETEEGAALPVSRLLKDVLGAMDLGNNNTDENIFTFGRIQDNVRKPDEHVPIKYISPAVFENFREKIKLVSREEYNTAQVKGNLMHSVLSKVYRAGHLQKAIQTTIAEQKSRDIYASAAQKIVQLFELNKWFDAQWKHINERSIWYEGKELRPDKVILSSDICIIIDYKTGVEKPEHIHQMKEYAKAYSSFYTQKIISYLIYLEDMQLVNVEV